MLLIWGSTSKRKDFGFLKEVYHCNHCNNDSNFKVFKTSRWFTFFWIPIFPFSVTHYVACPICNYGKEVTKDVIQKLQEANALNG